MKLQEILESEMTLLEKRYGINRNVVNGKWQIRLPEAGTRLVGDAAKVVLQNARPWIDHESIQVAQARGKKPGIVAFIEGDLIEADGFTPLDDLPLDRSPGTFQATEGRPIGFVKEKLPTPFVYMDTQEEYKGSKYAVFDGKSLLAYD